MFVTVTELGSLNKAAEAFGLFSAAASRHLAALEDRLGARLIERSTRRLVVTEVGKEFYNNSKPALLAMESAIATVSAT